jgi:peptidoglycan/LPS O-acetylase OafA/YrhL
VVLMTATAAGAERTPVLAPARLPSLTGLRFVAALLVFGFHAGFQGLFADPGAQAAFTGVFSQGGWTGVGFFFVLSGFVLTWSARPGDTVTGFWRRRFAKVYPNHLVTFVAAILLLTLVTRQVVGGRTAVANALLLQAWFPSLAGSQTVNTVSWSLSCEVLFYLSFPFLLKAIARIRPERLWAWAAAVIAVILVLPPVSALLPAGATLPWPAGYSESQWWLVYVFPPARLLDFVFGMLLARIVRSGRRLPLGRGAAAAISVAAYAAAPSFPGAYPLVAVTVLPLGLLIAAAAAADVRGRRTWIAGRVMVRLGELSFAFYLWHRLVLVYGDQWIAGDRAFATPAALGLLGALFAITLAVSALAHRLVERPAMRWLAPPRRRSRGPAAVAGIRSRE